MPDETILCKKTPQNFRDLVGGAVIRQPEYEHSWPICRNSTTDICKIEIAGHQHGVRCPSIFFDLLIRCIAESNITNMKRRVTARQCRRDGGAWHIRVEQKPHSAAAGKP